MRVPSSASFARRSRILRSWPSRVLPPVTEAQRPASGRCRRGPCPPPRPAPSPGGSRLRGSQVAGRLDGISRPAPARDGVGGAEGPRYLGLDGLPGHGVEDTSGYLAREFQPQRVRGCDAVLYDTVPGLSDVATSDDEDQVASWYGTAQYEDGAVRSAGLPSGRRTAMWRTPPGRRSRSGGSSWSTTR